MSVLGAAIFGGPVNVAQWNKVEGRCQCHVDIFEANGLPCGVCVLCPSFANASPTTKVNIHAAHGRMWLLRAELWRPCADAQLSRLLRMPWADSQNLENVPHSESPNESDALGSCNGILQ
jgi:hypothetical protein